MSIGPLGGLMGSVAGTSLAQTKGSEVERAQQDQGAQQRQVKNETRAEAAAGIGETDGQDHETGERDADGRRLWERRGAARSKPDAPPDAAAAGVDTPPPRPADPTGQSGSQLDLTG